MQDRSIDNALLALRRGIIRENGGGLEHVEALLRLRGLPIPKPCAYRDPFPSGELKRAILAALADGPKSGSDLCRHVMALREGMAYRDASKCVSNALRRLKAKGLVRRERRMWLKTQI